MKTTKAPRSSFHRSVALLALACGLLIAPAKAATVHGETDATVVWIAGQPAGLTPVDAEMRNKNRWFVPTYIVIPVGSSVRFPNDDPFYHSIYSDSKVDPFDIGYYGNGPGKSVAFPNPGVVDVHCHIHAYMAATIIVVDGPYAVAQNGSYSLAKVLPGKLTLHAWSPDQGERTVVVTVPNAAADVTLDVKR